ncbi:hypothetical protein JNW91_22920 [Micromonospora sp. STR1_7]|uniref:Uncharacterized protein n=1 Tax=Micromonospora parastrephiae TaxID=2806101 RepID=A0ABS1XYW7_9ACTN|nr:hypothetical protein [Micromonospora parastrephiae]MBM0234437.1 hypothetical protein [Micromonospora parastrephiae]
MTLSAVLLVTAVVWAVSVIRSVRLRALVYSLPLPMTLALISTGYRVDGPQVLGVLGLNLFFVTVAITYRRLRWPILLADGAGIAVYVALSAGLLAVRVPFEVALAGVLVLWLAAMLLRRRARPHVTVTEPPTAGRPGGLPPLLKLVVIFVGAVLTTLLGAVLRGMVVTFPYSGVLVAVEARRQLHEFSWHFARNSLALVGFLTAYHYLQDVSPAVALGAGWAAFALVAAVLHLPLRPRQPRRTPPRPPPADPGSRPGPHRRRRSAAGEPPAPRRPGRHVRPSRPLSAEDTPLPDLFGRAGPIERPRPGPRCG